MTIKEKIQIDFMEAYKAKNMKKKDFLGVVKGAIQTQEGNMVESTDENVLKVLRRIEKGINETLVGKRFMSQPCEDQEMELEYLKPYMPALMSDDEIRVVIKEFLTRADVVRNQGALMGKFNKEIRDKSFDNKMVSKVIQEELLN